MAPSGEKNRRLHLVHHHPGRLRIRSSAFQGRGTADAALDALARNPGVEGTEHNPITGGVLVQYKPDKVRADDILGLVAAASELIVDPGKVPDPSEVPRVVIDKARALNAYVTKLTGYRVDIRGLLSVGIAGLAGYSFLTGKRRLPRWDNLAFWAFSLFTQLHAEEIAAARNAPPTRKELTLGPSTVSVPAGGT